MVAAKVFNASSRSPYHLASGKADVPNTEFKKANGNTTADVLLLNTSHLYATCRARQIGATNGASERTISSMTPMQLCSDRSSGYRPFTQSCCVLLAGTKQLGNMKSKDRPLG